MVVRGGVPGDSCTISTIYIYGCWTRRQAVLPTSIQPIAAVSQAFASLFSAEP